MNRTQATMLFFDVAHEIIPDYSLLPEADRHKFETSAPNFVAGFLALVTQRNQKLTQISQETGLSGWYRYLSGYAQKDKDKIIETFEDDRDELIQTHLANAELEHLNALTIFYRLQNEFAELCFLKPHERIELAQIEYSQTFVKAVRANPNHIKQAFQDWEYYWKNDHSKTVIHWRKKINKMQLNQHLEKLRLFLPLTNTRLANGALLHAQLSIDYSSQKTTIDEVKTIDEKRLTDFFLQCITQNNIDTDFSSLQHFNHEQANHLAKVTLQSFHTQRPINFGELIDEYEKDLSYYLGEQLKLINNHSWHLALFSKEFKGSLSYLWKNKAVEFVAKFADAYSFMQYIGMVSQNDSPLCMLDAFNVARYANKAGEAKTILSRFFSSLRPLYNEYREIAFFEKNSFRKMLRILTPLVIMVGIIVLVATLVGSLALPELVFVAILLPTLILSLAITNQYVAVKNQVFIFFRNLYYQGDLPEFRVNERMRSAFGENAQEVRDYYVKQLSKCERVEKALQKNTILNDKELALKARMIDKKRELRLEWFDIHGGELSIENVHCMVKNRLNRHGDEQYRKLLSALKMNDFILPIKKKSEALKQTLLEKNDPLVTEKSIRSVQNSNLFFRQCPSAFKHKQKLEKLDKLSAAIAPNPS